MEEVISIKNDTICRMIKKSQNDLFFNDNIDENEKTRINNLMINIRNIVMFIEIHIKKMKTFVLIIILNLVIKH